mgnify:CR=1 FL=1
MKKDNTGIYFALMVISNILITVFGIWAIVEFILYLVKDNPFNWLSLWLTIGALVTTIFLLLKAFFSD